MFNVTILAHAEVEPRAARSRRRRRASAAGRRTARETRVTGRLRTPLQAARSTLACEDGQSPEQHNIYKCDAASDSWKNFNMATNWKKQWYVPNRVSRKPLGVARVYAYFKANKSHGFRRIHL